MYNQIQKRKSTSNKALALLCCFSLMSSLFPLQTAFADEDTDKAKQEKLDKLNSEYNNINTAVGVAGGLIGGDTGQLVTTAGQIANMSSHRSVLDSTASTAAGTAASSIKGIEGTAQGVMTAANAVGTLNNIGNDPIGSSQDLVSAYSSYATGGAKAAASTASNYLSVMGSIFGERVSESITYRSVGRNGKYVCDSSTKNPTVDETVSITCTGVPTSGDTIITPPSISFTDMPSSGGKYRKVGAGVSITWHDDWVEVLPIALEVEYNVYEGSSMMSDDAFYSQFDGYGDYDFYSLNGTDYNDYLKDFYSNGSSGDFYSSSGTLTDASAEYMLNNNASYDFSSGYSSTDGGGNNNSSYYASPDAASAGWSGENNFYSADGSSYGSGTNYPSAGWSGNGAFYNADGASYSSGTDYPSADGSWNGAFYNADGSSYGSGANYPSTGWSDNGAFYNADGSSYGSGTNYPSADGSWNGAFNNTADQSIENGSSYETRAGYASTDWSEDGDSYNAEASDWSNSNGMSNSGMTSSDVNNYFSDKGYSSDSMGGISEDLFGNTNFILDENSDNMATFSNGSEMLNDILANGGYKDEYGNVYNTVGEKIGSIKGPDVEFAMGSPELNKILKSGGYIDEYGNVHDLAGAIVGHVTSATASAQEYRDYMDDQSTLSKFLANMQNLFAGASGEQGLLDSLTGEGSYRVLDSLKSTFGLEDSSSVKKNTMSPQDMYKVAANILKKYGYTDEDIAKGANYDGNSAYSQPDVAWDLNRITTLQKSFKIDVKMVNTAKKSSLGTSSSRYKNIQK